MNPKDVVLRFQRDIIERGDPIAYDALFAPDFVNHTAPPGVPAGPSGMRIAFEEILRPALGALRVEVHDQIAEGDRVTTRKTIHGVHVGTLLGVPATGRPVAIDVIDIVRVADGRYLEHWGQNTLGAVVAGLRAAAPA